MFVQLKKVCSGPHALSKESLDTYSSRDKIYCKIGFLFWFDGMVC